MSARTLTDDLLTLLDREWPLTIEQLHRDLRSLNRVASVLDIEFCLKAEPLAVELCDGWVREYPKPAEVPAEVKPAKVEKSKETKVLQGSLFE